jgi:SAM-dependent methyltransferase
MWVQPIDPKRLRRLAARYYADAPQPAERFDRLVRETLRRGDRVLDARCGGGKFFRTEQAKELGCRVVGIDVGAGIRGNSALDARVMGTLEQLPFSDSSFDPVICRLVLEHLAEPARPVAEFHRVLGANGRLAVFTPNARHYFGLAARLTPHRFPTWFNQQIRGGDTFPNYYRANTRRRLARLLAACGFAQVRITMCEGRPDALGFFLPFYYVGVAYSRTVTRFEALSGFRTNLLALAVKG